MGGFENTASPDVYKRWLAFGCLSSHSRLHGSTSYRVPWLFDEESVDVLRRFTRLKCRLMPYLYQKAVEAHERGQPVMRAMCFEFPGDPGCTMLDRQYMLGDALMVVPVMDGEGVVEYFLPDGTWTDFLTGRQKRGGCWLREQYDYMGLPLLARENTVVPVGAVDARPDYDLAADVTFHVFALADGAAVTAVVPDAKGVPATTLTLARQGRDVTIRPAAVGGDWRVLLRGMGAVVSVEGAAVSDDARGAMLSPASRDGCVVAVLE